MTISRERTEQLDIFCCVTGFTSDFLSFIDVKLIWFFHGALQLLVLVVQNEIVGPHAGSWVVRIDPLHFLAGCRKS